MNDIDLRVRRSVLILSVASTAALAISERGGLYAPIAVVAALLSWRLVETTERLRVPQLAINIAIIAALGYACVGVFVSAVPVVPALGQFFVHCQVLKYFQTKNHRICGEIVVLSLMVMMAAAALSFEMLYAFMLAVYIFLGVHCLMLYTLSRVQEEAEIRGGRGKIEDVGEWRSPSRASVVSTLSLSRAAVGGALGATAVGVMVFMFLPRVTVATGPSNVLPSQTQVALTGFSDEVRFGDIRRLLKNRSPVMRVKFRRGGRAIRPEGPIRLRGNTYSNYEQEAWKHANGERSRLKRCENLSLNAFNRLFPFTAPSEEELQSGPWNDQHIFLRGNDRLSLLAMAVSDESFLHQEIWLEPVKSSCLFAADVPFAIRPEEFATVNFSPRVDQTFRLDERLGKPIRYEILSSDPAIDPVRRYLLVAKKFPELLGLQSLQRQRSRIPPRIIEKARVWTANISRSLNPQGYAKAVAGEIQSRLLGSEFSYSLELNPEDVDDDLDPIEDFLDNRKYGYCEYFASAMVLLCQSLRLEARIVNGFDGGIFNEAGGYYTFRQSDAHSWVEVFVPGEGWNSFDPTPSREREPPPPVWMSTVQGYADLLRHRWNNEVVNFGVIDHSRVMARLEIMWRDFRLFARDTSRRTVRAVEAGSASLLGGDTALAVWWNSSPILASIVIVAIIAALIGGSILLRSRLRPVGQVVRRRLKISRNQAPTITVEFYEKIVRLLARRGHVRPPTMTPLEFAETLVQGREAAVTPGLLTVTHFYYQVRYGDRDLTDQERRQVDGVVKELRNAAQSRVSS
jgi:transglutaminase-like putative cysteine protease